jgi:hypothetical protein
VGVKEERDRERYHPASRESMGDLIRAVRIHGFSMCGDVEPILGS